MYLLLLVLYNSVAGDSFYVGEALPVHVVKEWAPACIIEEAGARSITLHRIILDFDTNICLC
jgi:hypothetical protein